MSELPDNRKWLRDIPKKNGQRKEKKVPGPHHLFGRTTAQEIQRKECSAKRSLTRKQYIDEAVKKVNYKWQKKKKKKK